MIMKRAQAIGTWHLISVLFLLCTNTFTYASYDSSTRCHGCYDHFSKEQLVDPSDMATYSHSLQRNVLREPNLPTHNIDEISERRATYYGSTGESNDKDSTMITDIQKENVGVKMEVLERSVQFKDAMLCGICPTIESLPVVKYTKRIVASLLRQMKVQHYSFGPRETITIDLRAELLYEDLQKLYKFVEVDSSAQNSNRVENDNTLQQLAFVADIIGNLLHVVNSRPTDNTFFEILKERISVEHFLKPTIWIKCISWLSLLFVIFVLLQRAYCTSNRPIRMMFYIFLVFFIISCLTVFHDLSETVKAENNARLHQYDSIPKDCRYDEFGTLDSIGYYFRVNIFKYKDQCVEYHKQLRTEEFFHVSAVEAISEALSKLVFHPMEYIGSKLGKLLEGIVSAVPFWMQPILLVLVFVFGFLPIFGYRIKFFWISLEPAPSQPTSGFSHYLQDSPIQDHQQVRHQALMANGIGQCVHQSTRIDASTSTEDLENFIPGHKMNTSDVDDDQDQDTHPNCNTSNWNSAWISLIKDCCLVSYSLVLGFLTTSLRAVPQTQRLVINEENGAFEIVEEHFYELKQEEGQDCNDQEVLQAADIEDEQYTSLVGGQEDSLEEEFETEDANSAEASPEILFPKYSRPEVESDISNSKVLTPEIIFPKLSSNLTNENSSSEYRPFISSVMTPVTPTIGAYSYTRVMLEELEPNAAAAYDPASKFRGWVFVDDNAASNELESRKSSSPDLYSSSVTYSQSRLNDFDGSGDASNANSALFSTETDRNRVLTGAGNYEWRDPTNVEQRNYFSVSDKPLFQYQESEEEENATAAAASIPLQRHNI